MRPFYALDGPTANIAQEMAQSNGMPRKSSRAFALREAKRE